MSDDSESTLISWDRLAPVIPRGAFCEHPRMNYCCTKPCGHLVCPDCGLAWDEGAEK